MDPGELSVREVEMAQNRVQWGALLLPVLKFRVLQTDSLWVQHSGSKKRRSDCIDTQTLYYVYK